MKSSVGLKGFIRLTAEDAFSIGEQNYGKISVFICLFFSIYLFIYLTFFSEWVFFIFVRYICQDFFFRIFFSCVFVCLLFWYVFFSCFCFFLFWNWHFLTNSWSFLAFSCCLVITACTWWLLCAASLFRLDHPATPTFTLDLTSHY